VIDSGKRKLSAKQILTDIRSGMEASGLKRKYDLSDKALESVCKRLAATGALTDHEMRRLGPLRGLSEASPEIPERPLWHCPACNTSYAAEIPECPVCGVVVEKYVARQGQERLVLSPAPRASRDTGPSERKGWMQVIISIAVFVVAGSCLLLWSIHRSKEVPKISELDAGTQLLQQAGPQTGETQENSGDLENTGKDYSEVEIDDAQDTTVPQAPAVGMPQETPERTVAAPQEKTSTSTEKPQYVTGVLRRFSYSDFKKEVVEASKTYPVLFQFYSQT